jgi:tetratricopeptide (TPR) repeat protein
MERLEVLAKADLEKAVAIEPRLTPAYAGMIEVGGFDAGTQYAQDAAEKGLNADPSNYAIYDQLRWLAQPKWGGSADAMHAVVSRAHAYAKDNPVLVVLQAEPLALAANLDECGCHTTDPVPFELIFEQPARGQLLEGAGLAAGRNIEATVIDLSEADRFGWSSSKNFYIRINALVGLNKPKSALLVANRRLASKPNDEQVLGLRAQVYSRMDDPANAEKDLLTILSFTKDDLWALTSLAHEYVEVDHDWDKGWAATERVIKEYPAKSDGWFLRGSIQAHQPRPGLRETVDYYQAHFGSDPNEQDNLNQLKNWLAHGPDKPYP